MNFVKYWVPYILWACAIFFSSSLPGEDVPYVFPYQDIVFHFFVYVVYALLFCRVLNHSRINHFSKYNKICITIILSCLFAVSDEFHQQFIPGRFCSGTDLLIDTIAIFFSATIYPW